MTKTTQTAAAATPTPAAKELTVSDDMDSRRLFDSTADAAAYLNACADKFGDFGKMAIAAPGLIPPATDDGEITFDPAIYVEGMQPMVATLRKAKEGVKAIVITPVPTLDNLLSDDEGRAWVRKIVEKELNHVAVRVLRDAEDVESMVDQMPTTRGAFLSSARGEGGGIMETFNELYKLINAAVSAKAPVWAKARLIKTDLKKAFENKGYANEYFPSLENRGEGKDSLFVMALQAGVGLAKKKGLDPTIFERWLETRTAKSFTAGEEEDEDFDVASLSEEMMTEAGEAAPAASPAANATGAATTTEEAPAPVVESEPTENAADATTSEAAADQEPEAETPDAPATA